MTSTPHISLVFIAILALVQLPLTFLVIARRGAARVSLSDGGDETLLRRMRAHGNFTETVPITLLAMLAAEWSGAPSWLLWAGGTSLLVGRLLHATSIIRQGMGNGRAAGMVLTLLALASFAIAALLRV
ncbi:MAG: hypothetical protein RIQ60_1810 [Pseudomonadota bacterium]|jgi:uncharacterized membrane protein YecN with MAPEG domain